jgi:hypothetical protein
MCPSIQFNPLGGRACPEDGNIWLVPYVEHTVVHHVVCFDIRQQLIEKGIVARPVTVIARPMRRGVCIIRAPDIVGKNDESASKLPSDLVIGQS